MTNETMNKLPEICATRLISTGQPITIARGLSGYYLQPDDFDIEAFNKQLNVTPAQVSAMEAGSMWGWNTRASDPDNYDEIGELKK